MEEETGRGKIRIKIKINAVNEKLKIYRAHWKFNNFIIPPPAKMDLLKGKDTRTGQDLK